MGWGGVSHLLQIPILSGGQTYIEKVLSYSPIAYWPLNEASGSVANCLVNANQDGAYVGVTLGQTGIGDGETCPLFDGTNDYVDIYSATLNSNFIGAIGTLMIWLKVANSGVWTDTSFRRGVLVAVSASNYVGLYKRNNNNQITWLYAAGTPIVNKLVTKSSVSTTGWFNMAITWTAAGDQMIAYYNGVAEGSPQTSLGTWSGNLLEENTNIGSIDEAPTQVWNGYLAHCAIWDVVLTPTQILDLYTIPGA